MKRYSIYVLTDPTTNEQFYVGKTDQKIEKRMEHHLYGHSNPKNPRGYKTDIIISLLSKNIIPLVNEIDYAYGLEEALEREKFWIHELYKDGHPIKNREVCTPRRNNVFFTTNFPYGVAVPVGEETPTSIIMYGKRGNRIDPVYVVEKSSPFYLEIHERDYDNSIHEKFRELREGAYPFLKQLKPH